MMCSSLLPGMGFFVTRYKYESNLAHPVIVQWSSMSDVRSEILTVLYDREKTESCASIPKNILKRLFIGLRRSATVRPELGEIFTNHRHVTNEISLKCSFEGTLLSSP